MASNQYSAAWWDKNHDSAWDNVKDAFRRDWEQTKHDFGASAPDLKQDVPDTVKQAAGKEHIPPSSVPNFEEYESAFRYGYGARQQYGKQYPTWDNRLEEKLQNDWPSPDAWKRNSKAVRRAYEFNPKT